MILAGDIGGTNARFACLERKPDGGWAVHHFAKVKAADFRSFDEAIEAYLNGLGVRPARAAFAAAGPVEDGYIDLTNTDWHISAKRVARLHAFEACGLYNDFAGMTRSIPELSVVDFTVVREGASQDDEPILVAGAGTGFGAGYLVPTRAGWHVMATEGGHMAYSPQSRLETELLHRLLRDREYVSLELVSSGKGLPIIHKAICDIQGQPYEALEPDIISTRARSGDPICRDVCHVRAAATMGALGDLVLSGGARGGAVLAGGVSERMVDFYSEPTVMQRFLNRGPRSDYNRDVPIRLLTSPYAPLIGAAALLDDGLV